MIEEPQAEIQAPQIAFHSGTWVARWLLPICLFAGFSILYLSTHTRWYTFDSVAYATRIRQFSEAPKADHLIHPHHLLFNGLGYVFWSALDLVGIQVSSLQALQIMNSLVAALLVAIFYRLLLTRGFRVRGPPVRSNSWPVVEFTAALCLGVSFGFWAIATDGRVNAPAMFMLTVAIGFAWGAIDNLNLRQVLACALATALAVGLHQSHGLIIVFCTVSILLAIAPLKRKLLLACAYFAASMAGIAILYGLGALIAGKTGQFMNWALAYSQDGRWWKLDFFANLMERNPNAYTQAFIAAPPLPSEGGIRGWQAQWLHDMRAMVVPLAFVLAGLALTVVVLNVLRDRPSEGWRKTLSLFALIIPYGAFFTVWDPGYWVFWIPVSMATLLLAAILPWRAPLWGRLAVAAVLVVWAVASFTVNASASFWRRRNVEHNPDLVASMKLGAIADREDLMLVTGMGEAAKFEVYIPYFARTKVSVVHMELKRAGSDFGLAKESIRAKIKDTLDKGRKVYIAREYYSKGQWGQVGKRYKVPSDAAGQVLKGYERVELMIDSPVRLFMLRAIPNPSRSPFLKFGGRPEQG